MTSCKDQLIRKQYKKYLVSNVFHKEFIIYFGKVTNVNILGLDFLIKNINKKQNIKGFN